MAFERLVPGCEFWQKEAPSKEFAFLRAEPPTKDK